MPELAGRAHRAWRAARGRFPDLPLVEADGFHPTALGSYVTACVFYAQLCREDPTGLPTRFKHPSRRGAEVGRAIALPSEDVARVIQTQAWHAVRPMAGQSDRP